jgi:hypothetical protein
MQFAGKSIPSFVKKRKSIFAACEVFFAFLKRTKKMTASIAAQLQSRPDFRVHTGNLNKYRELILRRHRNSAEELLASLKLQLKDESAIFELK